VIDDVKADGWRRVNRFFVEFMIDENFGRRKQNSREFIIDYASSHMCTIIVCLAIEPYCSILFRFIENLENKKEQKIVDRE
jgi:hypothetical protein